MFKDYINALYHIQNLSIHTEILPFNIPELEMQTLDAGARETGYNVFAIYARLKREFPSIGLRWTPKQCITKTRLYLSITFEYPTEEIAYEDCSNNKGKYGEIEGSFGKCKIHRRHNINDEYWSEASPWERLNNGELNLEIIKPKKELTEDDFLYLIHTIRNTIFVEVDEEVA